MQDLFSLQGQTALVTGGSRGLGRQMATALARAGARVLISSRKADDLAATAAALQSAGLAVDYEAADAADPEAIQALVETAMARLGRIDILVNNAGASWAAPAEEHPLAAWDKVMNLNVRGYFLLAQAVARASMIPQRHGRIINIASIAGLAGNPVFMKTLAYNTSKGAVVNFTRALAGEWGRHGITVNAIAPGFFPSKMSEGLIAAVGEAEMTRNVPLQRLGDEEDLMGATLLFASAAGKHISGQVLAVDGGLSAILGA